MSMCFCVCVLLACPCVCACVRVRVPRATAPRLLPQLLVARRPGPLRGVHHVHLVLDDLVQHGGVVRDEDRHADGDGEVEAELEGLQQGAAVPSRPGVCECWFVLKCVSMLLCA